MFPPAPRVIVIKTQNSEVRVYCLRPRQHLLKVTKKRQCEYLLRLSSSKKVEMLLFKNTLSLNTTH